MNEQGGSTSSAGTYAAALHTPVAQQPYLRPQRPLHGMYGSCKSQITHLYIIYQFIYSTLSTYS